ncbi:MAG: hypothetical protein BWY33_01951 [Candidatus Dependentiae bacterium ADurb.Bin246]|nr:MAG: hypothetical protein BWY33_01951 [Candidatus Dependentiae bacterium ADurb.Bin246]
MTLVILKNRIKIIINLWGVFMKERPKASEIFNDTDYVFSKKVGFEKAFPNIEDITVEVEETGEGVYRGVNKYTYKKGDIGEFVDCSNSFCYGGGISIGSILREMVLKKETQFDGMRFCKGNEGSPKGKKIYRKCMNQFKVKVNIKYKI